MILITALLLLSYIASVIANESVLLTGNEKEKDFILYNNSRFTVFIESYPGYTWILENLEEVNKADIEALNLVPSNYGNEPNAGEYTNGYPQDESMGGYVQFIFKKNSSMVKDLPTLKFVYKNDSEPESKDIQAKVNLISGEGEPLSLGLINDPTSSLIKIEEEGGEYDLYVNSNSANFILLYGSISGDNTLSSGYSWYMENTELIESNNLVDFLELDTYANRPGSYYNPMTTLYKFILNVNDYTAKDVLPTLVFSYKDSAKSTSIKARAVVHLRSFNETIIAFDSKDNETKKNLNVERSEVLLVEFNGSPSTGYNWILNNAEEVKASKDIEVLNINEDGKAPFIVTTENKPGNPGVYRFKFQIKKDAEAGQLEPTLKFIHARSKNDVATTAELSLKVKKERKEEDLKDMSLPVIIYDKNANEDNVIYVESNTIIQFTEESNPSTGCSWIIKNQEEIDRSDSVDYIGSTYKSHCNNDSNESPWGMMSGCGGDETFSFRIWDIQEGDELPEIHMVYGHSWAIETEFYETLDIVLKVKNEKEKEEEKEQEKDLSDLPVIIYDKNASEDNVIYVESNTIVQFTEESNPSTGCSWIIKNQDEIDNSELVKYIGSTYKSHCDYNPNRPAVSGCGGDETFSFRIGDIQEGDELPEIHMVYGHSWAIETEYYETVDLVLKVKKNEDENEKKNEQEEDLSDLPVIIYDKNGSEDNVIYVESNTIVQFTEESNPSTGCSWIIKNQDEIDNSELVKYIGSTYKSHCDYNPNRPAVSGCGGDETFSFRIGDIQEGDELPEIHMVYGHSWAIETEFYETVDLVLKIKKNEKKEDLPVIIYDKNASEDNVIYVESNTIVQFTEESNPSTGCSWIIKNQDEIDNSELVKYIGSTYKSHCDYNPNRPAVSGCGGDETFSFRIGDIQEGDELPEIHMVYGHSWAIETEYYETVDLVLKVKKNEDENEKKNEQEEDLSDLPVIIYDKNGSEDNVIYVESNTIVQFTEESNPSTGCSWIIKNQDEIDNSELVKYIGSTYKSHCDYNPNRPAVSGCGGDETFSFRIGDIQEGDELPEIHMVYGHSWAIETEFYETLDLVLKVKNEGEKEESCTFKGYSCCTKANPKVLYQDKDGDWGEENGKWCYIKQEKQKEEEKDEPKLIRSCTGENLGYPCCEKEHKNIYTDSDGQWAVENGQWCGLPTCTYTGDYPVCKTTTKVIYTDSLKWGVENKQWCVLCL